MRHLDSSPAPAYQLWCPTAAQPPRSAEWVAGSTPSASFHAVPGVHPCYLDLARFLRPTSAFVTTAARLDSREQGLPRLRTDSPSAGL